MKPRPVAGKAFQRLLDRDERFSLDHAGGSRIQIGLGLSIPLLSTLVSPAFQRRHRDWVDVRPVDELSSGHPKQLDHVTTVRDGWLATTAHKAVWAVKNSKRRATSRCFRRSVRTWAAAIVGMKRTKISLSLSRKCL